MVVGARCSVLNISEMLKVAKTTNIQCAVVLFEERSQGEWLTISS